MTAARGVDLPGVLRAGALAVLVAAVLNVVVALAASALLDAGAFEPLEPRAVILSTVVAVGLGVGLYALLLARTARADSIFRGLAVVVAVGTAWIPFTLVAAGEPDATPASATAAAVLHLLPLAPVLALVPGRAGTPS